MAQQVIAAKDFDLYINFDAIGVALKIETGANFQSGITGTTEDIFAFSTDDPIATEAGNNTYDLTFSLQQAEATRIKDALAAASLNSPSGPIAHMRQVVEAASITAVWHKRRDVPATSTVETYLQCSGVEDSGAVERRSVETLATWHFRAKGMTRTTVLL